MRYRLVEVPDTYTRMSLEQNALYEGAFVSYMHYMGFTLAVLHTKKLKSGDIVSFCEEYGDTVSWSNLIFEPTQRIIGSLKVCRVVHTFS